jgi:hypothetical protein
MSSQQPPLPPEDATSSVSASTRFQIRRDVVACLRQLSPEGSFASPEQQALWQAALETLQALPSPEFVQSILLQELQRHYPLPVLHQIGFLLAELTTDPDDLKEQLTQLLHSPDNPSDAVKDALQLTLQAMGDPVSPETYLSLLNDPDSIITSETDRFLNASLTSPEALIDFLDFIKALPLEEQVPLLEALYQKHSPEVLGSLSHALLFSAPAKPVFQLVLKALQRSKPDATTAYSLWLLRHALEQCLEAPLFGLPETLKQDFEERLLLLKTCLSQLRVEGIFPDYSAFETQRTGVPRPSLTASPSELDSEAKESAEEATEALLWTFLPDALGNQGFFKVWAPSLPPQPSSSEKRWSILCVALHEEHGVLDAFGFQNLQPKELQRILDKAGGESKRIAVSEAYLHSCLFEAELASLRNEGGLPYEYLCWKPLLWESDKEALSQNELLNELGLSTANNSEAPALQGYLRENPWIVEPLITYWEEQACEFPPPEEIPASAWQVCWRRYQTLRLLHFFQGEANPDESPSALVFADSRLPTQGETTLPDSPLQFSFYDAGHMLWKERRTPSDEKQDVKSE